MGFSVGTKTVVLFALISAGATVSLPQAHAQSSIPGPRHTSARSGALGDAFLPLAEDGAGALFTNPAAIGKVREPQIEPMNFQFYSNSGFLDQISLRTFGFINIGSLSAYAPTLLTNIGSTASVGGSLLPTFYGPNFAVGILGQSELSAVANPDGTIHYKSLYRFVPAVNVGARLAGGIVRVGYTLQWVNQASGDNDNIPATTDPLGYSEQLKAGSALSHNAGFALTLPIRYLPQVNVVARNIMGTRYTPYTVVKLAQSTTGTPDNEPMTIDASVSIQPKVGNGIYMNLVLQDRDALGSSGYTLMQRLTLGAELSFRDKVFARAGWQSGLLDGTLSLGMGFRRKGGEFSFTWMSEEIGTAAAPLRERRFLMHYQVRAF